MLIPIRSPSHRAEQLTKSSKPSLGKVNPNLLVLLASALSWAEETFRLEAVLFKELRVDDFSQFLFPLQSFAKNTTDGSSGEEVWPDWAKVNLLGRFSKFWATFSNIGQVFCKIWGTLGGFLKPNFTLGHFFKWRIGQFNFFPKRVWSHWSHHGFFFYYRNGNDQVCDYLPTCLIPSEVCKSGGEPTVYFVQGELLLRRLNHRLHHQ